MSCGRPAKQYTTTLLRVRYATRRFSTVFQVTMFSAYTTVGSVSYSPSIDFLDESEREADPTWLPPLFGMAPAPLAQIDLSTQFETEKVIELYDDKECSYEHYDHEETLASGTASSSSRRSEDSSAQQHFFDINVLYSTAYPDFSVPSSAFSSLPSYSLPMPSSLMAGASAGATLRSPGTGTLSPSSPPASSTPLQQLPPSSPAIAWPLFDPSSPPMPPPPPADSPTTSHHSSSSPQQPQQTQSDLVVLKPATEVLKKKKTQPKAVKKQQGPKPRSKPQAKGRGSTAQACKQNWEALLQGTQLKDEAMLKGKWYWHLRGKAPSPSYLHSVAHKLIDCLRS